MRLSGDITRALEVNVQGLEHKLKALGHLRIGAKVFEPMMAAAKAVEAQIRVIQSMRITGDIVKDIREDLKKLENEFKDIKRINGPKDVFQNMISELKIVIPDLREMKKLLADIACIRMPSNQFGNDIEAYVRQIKELEKRMREIQRIHGPSGGGGGGSGGDDSGGGGTLLAAGGAGMMAGAAVAAGGFLRLNMRTNTRRPCFKSKPVQGRQKRR